MGHALENRFPEKQSFETRSINGTFTLIKNGERMELTQQDIRDARGAYDSGVRYADAQFGEFIDELKKRDLYNNSAIVLIGDHGENLGDDVFRKHGNNPIFGHWYIQKSTTHVPFIVRIPGVKPQRIKQPVSLIDIAPTLYDLQNIQLEGNVKKQTYGQSLLPLVNGCRNYYREYAISESTDLQDVALQTQDWKLIHKSNHSDLLYRLKNGTEKEVEIDNYQGRYRELLGEIEGWKNKTPTSGNWKIPAKSDLELENETRERLRNLGYLE